MDVVACPCFNMHMRVVRQEGAGAPDHQDPFVVGACPAKVVSGPVVRLREWTQARTVDGWTMLSCLLCNTDMLAYPVDHTINVGDEASSPLHSKLKQLTLPLHVRVNPKLKKVVMESARDEKNYSSVFGVILPELTVEDVDEGSDTPKSMSPPGSEQSLVLSSPMSHSAPAQEIQSVCSEFLRKEQEALDARIRAYIQKEQAQFDTVRVRVKQDRDRLLRELQGRRSLLEETACASRQRSGESAVDSAVPLSPISLPCVDLALPNHSLVRPKAYSNPVNIKDSPKSDVFELDEDRDGSNTSYLPADDEHEETDDSGAPEDIQHHAMYIKPGTAIVRERTKGYGQLVTAFGTSLPVSIPGRYWSPVNNTAVVLEEECDSSEEEMQPQLQHLNRVPDVHVQMRALARSIQAVDDPERLFGERPQRRRYKTGEKGTGPYVVVAQTIVQ